MIRSFTGIFLVCAFLSLGMQGDSPALIHRLIVQKNSSLVINGSTNVNSFQCSILKYAGRDTLVLIEGGTSKPYFKKGSVTLKAHLFDCGMKVMTNDFISTIKAKEFPDIVITFISLEKIPTYRHGDERFNGSMSISLAGTTKVFDVNCLITVNPSGVIHLKGGRKFVFSDFNLTPPQKMMGLIKIDEHLAVNFDLVLLLDSES